VVHRGPVCREVHQRQLDFWPNTHGRLAQRQPAAPGPTDYWTNGPTRLRVRRAGSINGLRLPLPCPAPTTVGQRLARGRHNPPSIRTACRPMRPAPLRCNVHRPCRATTPRRSTSPGRQGLRHPLPPWCLISYQLDGEPSGAGGTVRTAPTRPVPGLQPVPCLRGAAAGNLPIWNSQVLGSTSLTSCPPGTTCAVCHYGPLLLQAHVAPVNTELVMQPIGTWPLRRSGVFCRPPGGVCAPKPASTRTNNQPHPSTSTAACGPDRTRI